MACVGFLVFKGTAVIEKSFAVWSFVLYAIYLVFLVWSLSQFFGDNPWPSLEIKPGWFLAGVKYAGYNMVVIRPFCSASAIFAGPGKPSGPGSWWGPSA